MANQPRSPFCNSSRVTTICVSHCHQHMFSVSTSFRSRTFSTAVPYRHVRQLFAPAKARFFCFLGLPGFLFTVVLSELFPKPCSARMSGDSSLLPKSVCFLGLSGFLYTAVLFPRPCSAVTIGNSTFGCFDIVYDQGRPLTSTLFERMLTIGESS